MNRTRVSVLISTVFLWSAFAVTLGLNLYFRSFPVFFPQLRQQAFVNVEKKIAVEALQDIDKKYPGIPEAARVKLVQQQVREYHRTKAREFARQKQEEFARLKDPFQDREGTTYLMELDCWNWARYVANIGIYGHIGDQVRGGRQYDSLMLAPAGSMLLWNNFFFYSSWFLYRAFSAVLPVPVFHFLFYLPLFFITVFITLLFAFCYRYWGLTVAVIACLTAGLAPIFIPRSGAGWFDMDILNLIFPLAICWTYILSYHASARRVAMGWLVAAGFLLGLFAATWIAYPFIIFIILFFEAIYIANALSEHFQYKEDVRAVIVKHLVHAAVFLCVSFCWIFILCGRMPLDSFIAQVREATALNRALTENIWPNVYSTVGELKTTDYVLMAQSVGGIFLYLCGLACMLAVFLRIKRYDALRRDFAMLFVVWFIVMYLFCSKGVRFTMFLGIPLGIFLGWGIDEAFRFISKKKNRYLTAGMVVLLFLIANQFVQNGYKTAINVFPLMDDTWYGVLTNIKENTPRNAVINSWWDFGDWFKVVAGRKVIFDGQSQNTPQAYWMARALLTDSEQEALGILRMLNNGGNRAFDQVNASLHDPYASVMLVQQAVIKGKTHGSALLQQKLPAPVAAQVAGLLYATPPPAYFIVDSTMVGKMPAISFLGNWDFVKKYIAAHRYDRSLSALKEYVGAFSSGDPEVESDYRQARMLGPGQVSSWISRRLAFSNVTFGDRKDNGLVLFDNGFVFNANDTKMYAYSVQEGRYRMPQSLFVPEQETLREVNYPDSDARYSTLLLDGPETYKIINADRSLIRSVFARLYFLQGKGLKHFKPFITEKSQNNVIGVYEILWD